MTDSDVFRVLDANGNRAAEGLRVVEEYLRFCREDAFLSQQCKQLRHDLQTQIKVFPASQLMASRSTETDVGVRNQSDSEYIRPSVNDVCRANLRRACEAIRAMEEYSKLVDVAASQEFEQIRYRCYTLEKAVELSRRSACKLADAGLYVLVDLQCDEFENRIRLLLKNGVDVIQLREKNVPDRVLVEAAKKLRQIVQDAPSINSQNALLIINDRPDIAKAVGADGVHLGQDEMTVADARRVVGAESLIGVSTHSAEQARQAVQDGADYIGVGPVFPSQTKEFDRFVGIELVQQVCSEISLPAFAIGGIDNSRITQLVDVGCRRVAVSSAIWNAKDAAKATKGLCDTLRNARSDSQENC